VCAALFLAMPLLMGMVVLFCSCLGELLPEGITEAEFYDDLDRLVHNPVTMEDLMVLWEEVRVKYAERMSQFVNYMGWLLPMWWRVVVCVCVCVCGLFCTC
jgi:hypothetical protein